MLYLTLASSLCGFSTYCIPPLRGAYYSWQIMEGNLMRNGVQMGKGKFSRKYTRWAVHLYRIAGLSDEPAAGDINNDGVPEVVVVTYFDDTNGVYHRVYAFNGLTGDSVWMFAGDNSSSTNYFHGPPVIADVDGDGTLEVIVAQLGYVRHLFILNGEDGSLQDSMDLSYRPSFPLVADIDGDGRAEIVLTPPSYDTVYVFNGEDLSLLWKRYVGNIQTIGAAGDIDGDHDMDIVLGAADHFVALDGATGNIIWRTQAPYNIDPYSVAIYDADGDGDNEVAAVTQNFVLTLDGDGTILWKQYHPRSRIFTWIGAWDIDEDDTGEVVVKATGVYGGDTLFVFNGVTGEVEWFYRYYYNYDGLNVHIADIDPSPGYEVIIVSSNTLHVLSSSGSLLWTDRAIRMKNNGIADVDGDGCVEIVEVQGGFLSSDPNIVVVDDSSGASCPLGDDGNSDLSVGGLDRMSEDTPIVLYSVDGRKIYEGRGLPGSLRKGIYFVVQGSRSRKIVIR